MINIMFYSEDNVYGGGLKYFTDFIGLMDRKDKHLIVYCNRDSIAPALWDKIGDSMYDIKNVFPVLFMKKIKKIKSGFIRKPLVLFTQILQICYFLNIIRKIKPDIVHSFNGGYPGAESCFAVLIAGKILGKYTILNVVSLPIAKKNTEIFRDFLVRKMTDKVIVNAEVIKNKLEQDRGFEKLKINTVYNCVSENIKPNKNVFINENLLLRNKKLIGFVGRFCPLKGHRYLIKAMRLIVNRIPEARLILVGEGEEQEEIQKNIKVEELENHVCLINPNKYDVYEILSKLDVFAFPSLHEGFPYSILEAMNAGCPVVATDVGGIAEVIEDGVNGLLVEPYNSAMLAEKILQVLEDDILRRNIGEKAKNTIEERFNIKNMKMNINQLYNSVISNVRINRKH